VFAFQIPHPLFEQQKWTHFGTDLFEGLSNSFATKILNGLKIFEAIDNCKLLIFGEKFFPLHSRETSQLSDRELQTKSKNLIFLLCAMLRALCLKIQSPENDTRNR
jgi:hypothetical protein